MTDLEWLKEIEFKDLLTEDMKLIEEWCGIDVLISLMQNLPSLNLYISGKPLTAAKERYIREFYGAMGVKELAARLKASERFVYDVIAKPAKGRGGVKNGKF